ncbi:MAG TPA: 2-dehydropantoate 2-reductase [Polyangiaceae bacterium]|nr:2-dehydropantoate 2-reductase [Polyangiaceae bacterium]
MRVGIVGAGAVGGFVAVALSAAGTEVVLVGRSKLDAADQLVLVRRNGSRLSPGAGLTITRDLERLADCDAVLVTVKAQDTDAVAQKLATILRPETPIVSFQNGISNLERLRKHWRGPVLGAVVGFNVACEGAVRRQLTIGTLMAEDSPTTRALKAAIERTGIRLDLTSDIEGRIAGKLLINLANGVAGATGLPTAALLTSADARFCIAQCVREGLWVMRASGMQPARVTIVSPAVFARALLLPNWFLSPFVRAFVDREARASTLQDLESGKATEIQELNGALTRLGQPAPINQLVTEIVEGHTQHGYVTPADLRRRIETIKETIKERRATVA